MKKTAYFCALMLALCLGACGSVNAAQVTSSPAPTMELIPEVMPTATPEARVDTPSAKSDEDTLMTSESAASPSPMPDVSASPAVSETEASASPAMEANAAE